MPKYALKKHNMKNDVALYHIKILRRIFYVLRHQINQDIKLSNFMIDANILKKPYEKSIKSITAINLKMKFA